MSKALFRLFALSLVLAMFTACSKVPITGRSQLNMLPESELMGMGLTEYEQFLGEHPPLPPSDQRVALVRGIGDRLADLGVASRHRHQQRHAVALRVGGKARLYHAGSRGRRGRGRSFPLGDEGLAARDQQCAGHGRKPHDFSARGPYARLPFNTRLCH